MRRWLVLGLGALGALVVAASLVWILRLVVDLEASEREARAIAAHEEKVRLALWRMDSALTTFLAYENARTLTSFAAGPGAAPRAALPVDANAVPDEPAFVARRFELDAAGAEDGAENGAGPTLLAALGQPPLDPGPPPAPTRPARRAPPPPAATQVASQAPPPARVASEPPAMPRPEPEDPPQVTAQTAQTAQAEPTARNDLVRSEIGSQAVQNAAEFEQRANIVQQQADLQSMFNQLEPLAPDLDTPHETAAPETSGPNEATDPDTGEGADEDPRLRALFDQLGQPVPEGVVWEDLSRSPGSAVEHSPADRDDERTVPQRTAPPPTPTTTTTTTQPQRPRGPTGVLRTYEATWIDDRVVLARRVVRDGAEALQAVELDDAALRSWLRGLISDLLPAARLEPAQTTGNADPGRRLALLPYRLDPGPVRALDAPATSPARLGLLLAFGSIVLVGLGAAAVAVAGWRLGRRRSEFASAVIHELRTPLTTFRLYTDMLAEGIVPEAERPAYLETLRHQADRLGHLVENVLAYARLERPGTVAAERATLTLGPWLREVAPRLGEVAERAGLRLDLSVDEEAENAEIRADPVSLERILDNLCDNSCKYAADGGVVALEAEVRAARAVLTWRDAGPGVPRRDRRGLFRPFRRGSAGKGGSGGSTAVEGIGLGLALSRTLARRQGGDLVFVDPAFGDPTHDDPGRGGAAFELRLPLARSS